MIIFRLKKFSKPENSRPVKLKQNTIKMNGLPTQGRPLRFKFDSDDNDSNISSENSGDYYRGDDNLE